MPIDWVSFRRRDRLYLRYKLLYTSAYSGVYTAVRYPYQLTEPLIDGIRLGAGGRIRHLIFSYLIYCNNETSEISLLRHSKIF